MGSETFLTFLDYPASCIMRAGFIAKEKKRPDLDVDHPLSSAEIKERVELFPYILLVLAWLVTGQPLLLPSLCVDSRLL
jgi:hypothetical protein